MSFRLFILTSGLEKLVMKVKEKADSFASNYGLHVNAAVWGMQV
jgi:hypothetical protein